MAKDAQTKTTSPNDDTSRGSSSQQDSDQQRVPPLRIVLNTSTSNQKNSSSSASTGPGSQNDSKRGEKSQDSRGRTAGDRAGLPEKVRFKLGLCKDQAGSKTSEPTDKADAAQKSLKSGEEAAAAGGRKGPEPPASSSSTAPTTTQQRRITRRSHKNLQAAVVTNEDEESVSSMTSADENLNSATPSNLKASDQHSNSGSQDATVPETAGGSASSPPPGAQSTSTASAAQNADTPRRACKRRKVDSSDGAQASELDGLFGLAQSFRAPVQNSFELFKGIRRQVDKKLKSLNVVQPSTPYGFKHYLLARGAYLLEGNKLGNGTSLFAAEDGSLSVTPLGKFHALRSSRTSYSFPPNRSRVPLGLPVDSPLYNLFIEQEKERYRMRMQHLKEREKLTLAAEQEIVRVYSQAALAAANQPEPFSACTMLKHQEIYNYLDVDGSTIMSAEDSKLDEGSSEPEGGVGRGGRRRAQRGSTPPALDNGGNSTPSAGGDAASQTKGQAQEPVVGSQDTSEGSKKEDTAEGRAPANEDGTPPEIGEGSETTVHAANPTVKQEAPDAGDKPREDDEVRDNNKSHNDCKKIEDVKTEPGLVASAAGHENEKDRSQEREATNAQSKEDESTPDKGSANKETHAELGDTAAAPAHGVTKDEHNPEAPMEVDDDSPARQPDENGGDDKACQDAEIFLNRLQEVDDKWDRIRTEMLTRHRHEAESLHAIQKLEWEWKTKEVDSTFDVRNTSVIDDTLVPKLNIHSQDY